ncbi:MAG: 6-carboxytetrahydropterin synthase [Bdellovibrionaceae bacterium]|nr:6-carboxytetrahydropterin synthase [Pseudobdellovibrionaceae bacterium]MDW8190384.1 6-carboxytetrahydropterin synthase [Pseudobdellovibrionaceae bacterium]
MSVGLHVFKQNLKFSSAHFLIFDAQRAERLHGHNYQLSLQIWFPSEKLDQSQLGYLINFSQLKMQLKSLVDLWDEKVLLPQFNQEFKVSEYNAETWLVHFRNRVYAFPKEEVVWLPVTNTSVESLSRILAHNCFLQLKDSGFKKLEIFLEETPGQGASFEIEIK